METTTKTSSAARARSGAFDTLARLAGWAAACGGVFHRHLYFEAPKPTSRKPTRGAPNPLQLTGRLSPTR